MNERRIHQIFQISILLKGAHALIECIGGLVLAFVSASAIPRLVNILTQFKHYRISHQLKRHNRQKR